MTGTDAVAVILGPIPLVPVALLARAETRSRPGLMRAAAWLGFAFVFWAWPSLYLTRGESGRLWIAFLPGIAGTCVVWSASVRAGNGETESLLRTLAAAGLYFLACIAVPFRFWGVAYADKALQTRVPAIRTVSPQDSRAQVLILVGALGDADPYVRRAAARRLGRLKGGALDAVPALSAALNDGDERARLEAEQALTLIAQSTTAAAGAPAR